jgi:hypothetical protein
LIVGNTKDAESASFFHLPLRNEISVPNTPKTAIPIITIPIGIPPGTAWGGSFSKVGITRGGGGVKVGNLVGGKSIMNCAAKVGSIVGVVRGVGVGGGSTIGMLPLIETNGE